MRALIVMLICFYVVAHICDGSEERFIIPTIVSGFLANVLNNLGFLAKKSKIFSVFFPLS